MKKRRSATKKPMFPTRVRSLCLSLCLAPQRRAAAPSGPFVRLWALVGPREGAPPPASGRKYSAAMGGPHTAAEFFTLFCGGFTFFNVKPPIYKPIIRQYKLK